MRGWVVGDLMDLTDDVVARAGAGDSEAFAALYRDVQPRLRRYASVLVGQHADDVTAAAWRHVAGEMHTCCGGLVDFRAWTARIVRNLAIDALRHQSQRPVRATPTGRLHDATARDDTELATLQPLSTPGAIELVASLPRDWAEAIMLRAVIGSTRARREGSSA